ncbi:hypothetical protein B10525_04050 [Campylobacter jejuni]|nr:hypothetical protein B10525_04050 [Campylobacter jejuni]
MGQLKFTYPQMPNEMREKYSRGTLKGVLFDGGNTKLKFLIVLDLVMIKSKFL